MKASRMDYRRAVDWSAVADPNAITNVIQALICRRINPMREKEIARWFFATPKRAISEALMTMLDRGQVKAGRSSLNRNRNVLTYWMDGRDD